MIINSEARPSSISIWDTSSLHRGEEDVFERMRHVHNREIRGLDLHLTRLQTSPPAVGCPLPESGKLAAASPSPLNNTNRHISGEGRCLRLIVTKGDGPGPHDLVLPSVIMSWSPLGQQ